VLLHLHVGGHVGGAVDAEQIVGGCNQGDAAQHRDEDQVVDVNHHNYGEQHGDVQLQLCRGNRMGDRCRVGGGVHVEHERGGRDQGGHDGQHGGDKQHRDRDQHSGVQIRVRRGNLAGGAAYARGCVDVEQAPLMREHVDAGQGGDALFDACDRLFATPENCMQSCDCNAVPLMFSEDTRQHVLGLLEESYHASDVAEIIGCSGRSMRRWLRHFAESGTVWRNPRLRNLHGYAAIRKPDLTRAVLTLLESEPAAFLRDHVDLLVTLSLDYAESDHRYVSAATVYRVLRFQ